MGCFSPVCFKGFRRRRRLGEKATVIPSVTGTTISAIDKSNKAEDDALKINEFTHEASIPNSGTHSSSKKSKSVFFDFSGAVEGDLQVLSSDAATVTASKCKIYGDMKGKGEGDEQIPRSSSNYSFLTVFPRDPNRRYGDFSDSEEGDHEDVETERQMVNGSKIGDENETSGSLFSISVGRGARGSAPEIDEKEVSSPISSLLKLSMDPQTQVSIKKSSKSSGFTGEEIEENLGFLENEEQRIVVSSTPVCNSESDNVNAEIVVDASLSAWIEDKNPSSSIIDEKNKNIAEKGRKIHEEDRPILGALTMEEIKLMNTPSGSPSTRKFVRRNAEDSPIIGTVGSYWKHTNQTSDSVSSSSPLHT